MSSNPLYGSRVLSGIEDARAMRSRPVKELDDEDRVRTVWRRYSDNVIHRENGPAVEYGCGIEEWRQEGLLHREDGPALIAPEDGAYGPFPYGEIEQTTTEVIISEVTYDAARLCGPGEVWFREGKIHRDDGPALTDISTAYERHEEWWKDGKLHRDNGPAYEIINDEDEGTYRWWYRHGKLHRTNGPAQVWEDEDGEPVEEVWWLDDEELTVPEWRKRLGLDG